MNRSRLAVLPAAISENISCDFSLSQSIDEPAADLGICVAMASSFANRLLRPKTIVFGEVGLSGEVRAVSQADLRVNEAKRLGYAPKSLLKEGRLQQVADKLNILSEEDLLAAVQADTGRTDHVLQCALAGHRLEES